MRKVIRTEVMLAVFAFIFVLPIYAGASDHSYAWHTFYGSTSSGEAITVDGSGNVYVTGNSYASWNGPSGQAPLNPYSGADYNTFVLKLNSSGAYQWHTFYGSAHFDYSYSIAFDGIGNVYVTGRSNAGNDDVVILKLNSSGAYQWHTFYGSAGTDIGLGIAVDGSGNVYVTGYSDASWNGPSGQVPLNPYSGADYNTFVLKLTQSLLYANFGPSGVWVWNGTTWNQINAGNPSSMAAAGALLYANFGAAGVWVWNGTTWNQINAGNPTSMVALGTLLYANFVAAGVWVWNGTTWNQINADNPTSMAAAGSLLYANFGAAGVWRWDGTTWNQINAGSPASMALDEGN